MTLTTRERKALSAARYPDGADRGELAKYGIGEKTIGDLLERGLLEECAHPVTGRLRYRTTAAGKESELAPTPPKPARNRPRLKMMKPTLRTMDPRTVKPMKTR
ncbi:hypothetical protein [Reyranella sp.]|uniref:hypothetical protein n=1 Tax=Reyranella sp. TaxID=1929291 RepID=UPI0027304FD4|nr:hypothetical protein [Reyranella sp.]MDP2376092.1 hypothetical protein [Reyranella sp.]